MLQIVLVVFGLYQLFPALVAIVSPDMLVKMSGLFAKAPTPTEMFLLLSGSLLSGIIGAVMIAAAKKPELRKVGAWVGFAAAMLSLVTESLYMSRLGNPPFLKSDVYVQGIGAVLLLVGMTRTPSAKKAAGKK
jgi:hypothetical protein